MTPGHRPPRARRLERGTTLLEAMIALAILLVGLLGMAQLQFYGMNATQGARARTIATQLASELAGALGRLDAADPHLDGVAGPDDTTPPATFGDLLPLGVPTTGVHVWSDSDPVPGAHLDASLEGDPENPGQPLYHRRWTVWNTGVAAAGVAAKLVAVSVIYRERGIPRPREVVVYVSSQVTGSFMANINAFK